MDKLVPQFFPVNLRHLYKVFPLVPSPNTVILGGSRLAQNSPASIYFEIIFRRVHNPVLPRSLEATDEGSSRTGLGNVPSRDLMNTDNLPSFVPRNKPKYRQHIFLYLLLFV